MATRILSRVGAALVQENAVIARRVEAAARQHLVKGSKAASEPLAGNPRYIKINDPVAFIGEQFKSMPQRWEIVRALVERSCRSPAAGFVRAGRCSANVLGPCWCSCLCYLEY